jgi:hypothetical protein
MALCPKNHNLLFLLFNSMFKMLKLSSVIDIAFSCLMQSISPAKADEFTLKKNILSAFA